MEAIESIVDFILWSVLMFSCFYGFVKKPKSVNKMATKEKEVILFVDCGVKIITWELNPLKRVSFTHDETIEYAKIFEVSPYSANVFLLLLELKKNEKIILPKSQIFKAQIIEYLMEIRFQDPRQWQLSNLNFN